MCAKQVTKKAPGEVATTGHSWDGIEELNNPLPRWWVWVFWATIVWSLGYVIAYPAWPLVSGATQGILGKDAAGDSRLALDKDIAMFNEANAAVQKALVDTPLDAIPANQDLMNYAIPAGAAVFRTYCAQCHQSEGAGLAGKGYPSLKDNDWLWGGTLDDIYATVQHGIRNTTDADARYSQMPAFGTDELLDATQIGDVVQYVLQISGQEHDAAMATAGATVFAENCVACHGEAGMGDRAQGAPNLTDAIWLYGGDVASLTNTVTYARFGVMPAWGGRLSEDEIRAVALYVHSLGGGE
ncbi:cytochrome-c oxidase, cbb3-type subunit III [Neotabrizicola shimadae]|uniref:Cbb3-type cytochrome c oxidase subunit n=1 Tax=Neotabrizicola shimadae TaxID=2807096 RepID=A0A8G0ZQH2_9RHOB|nr:cytochrome-c oxidase, cbb3-type subunit III [Neotabrizicola shimadae]QYZ68162.1 cytochrome-c oxidase, cbb3-type subunit III [Neotabrizicola shimadae]